MVGQDGQKLSFEINPDIKIIGEAWGDPKAPPVLLLHGGGQTRHSWGDSAKFLGEQGWYAIAYDARGHGDSSWSPDGKYNSDRLVGDLRGVLKYLSGPPAVVGASMGGITALLAAGESSKPLFSALVLVDIAPKVEQKGVERIFKFMSANLDGFASIAEASEAVAKYLPQRKQPQDVERLKKNLRKGSDGRYYWHWDPQILESWKRSTPQESQEHMQKMWDAAKSMSIPVLIVRGGMSDVISEQIMAEFIDLVPHARSVDVSGAGHMVAGDSNHAFTRAVVEFLRESYPPIS